MDPYPEGQAAMMPEVIDIATIFGPVHLIWTRSQSGPKVRRIVLPHDLPTSVAAFEDAPRDGELPDDSIRALIPPEDFVLPDGRQLEVKDFLADVAAARLTNRTMTVGLSDPYTACLAAAILDERQHAVATICCMVPAGTPIERREMLLDELTTAAHNVSGQLTNKALGMVAR